MCGTGVLLDFFFQPSGNLISMIEHDFENSEDELHIVFVLAGGDRLFQLFSQNCKFTGKVISSVISAVTQHFDDEICDRVGQTFVKQKTTNFFENLLDGLVRIVITKDFLKIHDVLMHNLHNLVQRNELD